MVNYILKKKRTFITKLSFYFPDQEETLNSSLFPVSLQSVEEQRAFDVGYGFSFDCMFQIQSHLYNQRSPKVGSKNLRQYMENKM